MASALRAPLMAGERREADDFAQFVLLLAKLTRWLSEATLTGLCVVLAVLALLAPWRFAAVALHVARFGCHDVIGSQADFREWACLHFLQTFADIFVIPFAAVVLLWPPRWRGVTGSAATAWKAAGHLDWAGELRVVFLRTFFTSVLPDVVAVPFFFVACVSPWRIATSVSTVRRISRWPTSIRASRLDGLRNGLLRQGLLALCEAPLVLWGAISMLVPWLIPVFLRRVFSDRNEQTDAGLVASFLLAAPLLAVCDILAVVFGVLAAFNPVRARRFARCLSAAWAGTRLDPGRRQLWDWNLAPRSVCLRFGVLCLLDLLVLPCTLVVLLTVYRAKPLVRAFARVDEKELPDDQVPSALHKASIRQFLFLVLDALALPFTLVVFATRYQWHKAVQAGFDAYHCVVVRCVFVILHDAVLGVALLLPMLSMYRARRICKLLHSQEVVARGYLWEEVRATLLDICVLPLLLLLIVTLWRSDLVLAELRAESSVCFDRRSDLRNLDRKRRRLVCGHCLKLLRDLAGLLAAFLVVVSVVRLPKFLLTLWAQRAAPLLDPPRFQLNRVTCEIPSPSSADRRPHVTFQFEQQEKLTREEIRRVRLNVVSAGFWDEVAKVLGESLSNLGRGILPLTLVDGKHLKFDNLLPVSSQIDLRIGGQALQSKLLQLDASIGVCVQLELVRTDGSSEVLTRLSLPLALMRRAVTSVGEAVELPPEALDAANTAQICGPFIEAVGVREAMWFCASMQLCQLSLDILHLVLFVCSAVAPWQLAACCYYLLATPMTWTASVARQAVSLASLHGNLYSRCRQTLEPLMNATAKQLAGDGLDNVARRALRDAVDEQLYNYPLPPRWMERSVLRELRRTGSAAAILAEALKGHLVLHEAAAFYLPSLSICINLQKVMNVLDPHEHAYALEKVTATCERAEALLVTSLGDLRGEQRRLDAVALEFSCSCKNLWNKPLAAQRHLVRIFALRALVDWVMLLLLVLLILTVYRLPLLYEDFRRASNIRRRDRILSAVTHQSWLIAQDMWSVFTALVASALAIVTLIRALDFLTDVVVACRSLRDIRRCAFRRARQSCGEISELVTLLTVWKTYKFVVSAAVFSLLLPASGLPGPIPRPLRIGLWIFLCGFTWTRPINETLGALYVVALLSMVSAMKKSWRTEGIGMVDTISGRNAAARFSWANVLAIGFVLVDAALLAGAPGLRHLMATPRALHAATVTCVAWLLVIALPLVIPTSDQSACLGSVKFHACVQFLRRCCFLPAAGALLTATCAHTSDALRLHTLLLVVLLVTSTLCLASQQVGRLPIDLGLDLVHPPLYLAGMSLAQCFLLSAEIGNASRVVQASLSLLPPLWAATYSSRNSLGGPSWVPAIHICASLIPVLSIIATLRGGHAGMPFWIGLATIAGAGATWASRLHQTALRARGEGLEVSGIAGAFAELARKSQILVKVDHNVDASALCSLFEVDPKPSSTACAAVLENFEVHVRIERLDKAFLTGRRAWLRKLHDQRHSLFGVASCAKELAEAVRTPPSSVLIICLLRRGSAAARRVSPSIWSMIMEAVGDVHSLELLLNPITNYVSRAGSPEGQFEFATCNVKWCMDALTSLRRAAALPPPDHEIAEALSALEHAGSSNDWLENVADALRIPSSKSQQLDAILRRHSWTGEKFRSVPIRSRLLEALKKATEGPETLLAVELARWWRQKAEGRVKLWRLAPGLPVTDAHC